MSETKRKKLKGETKDAYLVRDMDPLHVFMTGIMGPRTDNEAVCKVEIPMDCIYRCLETLNASQPEFKYTFFHVICAAIFRTVQDRKMLNYFIRGGKFYERKKISLACIAKKRKADGAEEGLVIMHYDRDSQDSPLLQIHNKLFKQVSLIRNTTTNKDNTSVVVSKLVNLPKPLYKFVLWMINRLDSKGKLPKELRDASPYEATCFASNLGSIKMDAEYHHLINFGTNSFFLIVGEKTKKPVFHEDGSFELKEFLPLSLTIDERIADGVYFANSIKVLKAFLMKPEYLLKPANEVIDTLMLREETGVN